jgi:D-glycero-alpha-D-manno-heptose-7-phosphate kinase
MVMIITRSPLRVSLGGGGTDLPSYSSHFGGSLIAGAINKYVYVSTNRPFQPEIILKYSNIEIVQNIDLIKHPIIREVLKSLNLKTPQIEISSLADIPAGTGLGSSGSFTTALIKTLYSHYRKNINPQELAELACEIEIDRLGEPVGKQDQYIASYGGLMEFIFNKDGSVTSSPLDLSMKTVHDLDDNLLLFFTGISRSASSILKDQVGKSEIRDQSMIDNLHFTKALGVRSKQALLDGNTNQFGQLMAEHWEFKKSRSAGISNDFIPALWVEN